MPQDFRLLPRWVVASSATVQVSEQVLPELDALTRNQPIQTGASNLQQLHLFSLPGIEIILRVPPCPLSF